ncbi:MAG: hypothetical protein KGI79_01370 [Patescibacteria group bacterium]|nr:hypothetical protein [Patescibacteria group bacterium]MDE2116508.1 hypothetical protein [Patescibacteria group bacterium]
MKKSKTIWWIIGIVVLGLVLIAWSNRATNDHRSLSSVSTSTAPWPADVSHLRERLAALGLPALSQEGTALHIHQHIDIFIDGKSMPVPAGVGIDESAGFISDVHVHDDTGIIHVESPTIETFTLGQFFDIWGVRFTAQAIGGYETGNGRSLKVFVNGVPYGGDPRQIALAPHQEIVVAYGTDRELPNPIPSSYQFPVGD